MCRAAGSSTMTQHLCIQMIWVWQNNSDLTTAISSLTSKCAFLVLYCSYEADVAKPRGLSCKYKSTHFSLYFSFSLI